MKNGYKKLITDRIKDEVNRWIDEIKSKSPDLLLTKQWSIIFPKGFHNGHNALLVVTGSKQGQHLIAEVQFVLPEDLELDINNVELVLKNEPYQELKPAITQQVPVPIDEPLDVINDLVIGINEFLQSLNISIPTNATLPSFLAAQSLGNKQDFQIKVNPLNHKMSVIKNDVPANDSVIDKVRKEMLRSPFLPEWFRTIESQQIWDELLNKLAEALLHYQNQLGRTVDLKEFFEKYTEHLLQQGKLYSYCKYKSKPIQLDDSNRCVESYCSKKPYNGSCPLITLKFGNLS
jgi:hypothetical protein